jgi:hypothetical protein
MFSPESMTKLEDLTVLYKNINILFSRSWIPCGIIPGPTLPALRGGGGQEHALQQEQSSLSPHHNIYTKIEENKKNCYPFQKQAYLLM